MADVKNFLYAWCGKKKLTPNYDIRAAGNKNRQKFMCEVRCDPASPTLKVIFFLIFHHLHQVQVSGFSYTGMGNSTNKKDAQTNAARDFVNFLVRTGEVTSAEVPTVAVRTPRLTEFTLKIKLILMND